MTSNKQIQMVMRDMLFITWAVEPEALRKLLHARLELDTLTRPDGREMAFISAVCFHVTELRSSVVPVPSMTFQQVNYRTYVRAGGVPAVFFFAMKINSRMVTAVTSFLSVPVHYEEIQINTSPGPQTLSYQIRSSGLLADAMVGLSDQQPESDEVPHQFITQRLVGYARAGNATYRIDVEQPGLASVSARIQNVKSPSLESLGLLTTDQSSLPYSALYVREGLFGANAPVREW